MAQHNDEGSAGRGFGTGYAIVGAGFQLVFSMLFFMGMGYLTENVGIFKYWQRLSKFQMLLRHVSNHEI